MSGNYTSVVTWLSMPIWGGQGRAGAFPPSGAGRSQRPFSVLALPATRHGDEPTEGALWNKRGCFLWLSGSLPPNPPDNRRRHPQEVTAVTRRPPTTRGFPCGSCGQTGISSSTRAVGVVHPTLGGGQPATEVHDAALGQQPRAAGMGRLHVAHRQLDGRGGRARRTGSPRPASSCGPASWPCSSGATGTCPRSRPR